MQRKTKLSLLIISLAFTIGTVTAQVSITDQGFQRQGSDTLYKGDSITLEVEFNSTNSNYTAEIIGDSSWSHKVNKTEFEISFPLESIGTKEFTLRLLKNGSIKETRELSFRVKPVWQLKNAELLIGGKIVNRSTVDYRDLENLVFGFKVLKRGKAYPYLDSKDVYLEGDEAYTEKFVKTDAGDGDGKYRLELSQQLFLWKGSTNDDQKLPPKNLGVYIESDGSGPTFGKIGSFDVEKDVHFSGRVLDISGNPVEQTRFTFVYNGGKETRSVDSSGRFNYYFPKSRLNRMKMQFPKGEIQLENVDVSEKDVSRNIRYNYYDNDNQPIRQSTKLADSGILSSVRPVNLMAINSNYPFRNFGYPTTYVRMNYDTSNGNALNVSVYECSQWTFMAEECSSKWEKVSSDSLTFGGTAGKVTFPLDPLSSSSFESNENYLSSAFLVGVKRGTDSAITLSKSGLNVSSSSLKVGKELKVSGKLIGIRSDDAVGSADVTLSLLKSGEVVESYTTVSGSNGVFSFSKKVPDEEGEYQIRIRASKGRYDSLSMTSGQKIEVYYETGMSISSPSSVKINLGEQSDIEYEVENTGQAPITDIEFSVDASGSVDGDRYWVNPESLEKLASGETETIELFLNLSEDFCPYPCSSPTFTLTAEGTSAGKSLKSTAQVSNIDRQPPQNQNSQQKSQNASSQQSVEQNSNSSSSFSLDAPDVSNITGQITGSQTNMALAMILVFTLVLAAAIKKKQQEGGDRGSRDSARGRPMDSSRVTRPDVSAGGTQETPDEEKEEQNEPEDFEEGEESSGSEDSGDPNAEEDGVYVCDTCGEEFDTESGVKLHRKAMH